MPFTLLYTITDSDLTKPYRHVHHSRAVQLLELARMEHLRSIGMSFESLFAGGVLLVISALQVEYKRELLSGEISITVQNPSLDGKRLFLEQQILNDSGKLAVFARIEQQFLSLERKRAVEPPEQFLRAIKLPV